MPVPPVAGAGAATGLTGEWQQLRVFGGGLLVVLCFALFGWHVWRGREPVPISIGALGGARAAEIKVHVDGAVVQPGVYRLAQGDRVEDAIHAAGGLAPNADGARLNLAQRVRDEQRLDVPFVPSADGEAPAAPEPPPAGQGSAAGAANTTGVTGAPLAPAASPRAQPTPRPTAFSGGRVNVNVATQAQLEQLPGIGTVSAQRIIQYRNANGPLRSLDDLRRAGISQALINRAADYIAFE